MDEGNPIAVGLLEDGVRVIASDGVEVGKVAHVIAAPEKDIFHGLVISTPDRGVRFVEAAEIASLHEFGVDLRIDSAAARQLPEPSHGAPVYNEDPSQMKGWHHWVHKAELRGDWRRER